MHWIKRLVITAALVIGIGYIPLGAQGTLSNQVLQLLTRVGGNSWTTTNTFADLRVTNSAIPSITTYRIYADTSGNLYFNGGLIAGAGGGVTPHNLLSTTHPDTLTGSPVRGSVIVANSTPKWAALTVGANHTVFVSNGTDAAWGTDGSGLTSLTAANLTGTLPAISGVNLTNLNASNLASGTVPLAQLANIANAQISASAAIAYSKLALSNSIVNADIAGGAGITYAKLSLTGSVVTGDLAAATLLFNRWAQNGASANQVPMWNGAAWAATTITQSMVTGAGTVTSVALSVPAFLSVSGSPVTTSGTLAVTAANQTANTIFAGPTSGGAVAPAFRALVNADFPTSGVTAGTYPLVTVNAQGIVTAGSSSFASGTIVADTPWLFTQTWNNAGVAFTALKVNVTNTNSSAGALLEDLQIAGVSKFSVDKNGAGTLAAGLSATTGAFSSTVSMTALTATTGAFSSTVSMTALTATSGTFSGLLSANLGLTVAAGQTAAVTDLDKLTVGGNIIPNTRVIYCEGLDANTLSGDCNFILDRAYQVTSIKINQTAQGAGGCVIDVEKLTGTTAPGAGTVLGTGSYDCNATANNTVTTYTLTGTTATLQFAAGNRIAVKMGGTLTGLRGGSVMIQVKSI